MNPTKPLLTRADIVALLGGVVTERQVRSNEKRWGLDSARVPLNKRRVVYRANIVVCIFRARGLIP